MQQEVGRANGRGAAAIAVAGLLLAAACSGAKSKAEPRVTVPLATTTTDPYAPPPVIDVAYVNRVLAGLDQVVGDVVRAVVRDRALTPQGEEYLRALYSDEGDAFAEHGKVLRQNAEAGLPNARPQPGNQITSVSQLLSTTADCVFAQVHRDYSAVAYRTDPDATVLWVGLKRLDPSRDPARVNPTRWMYVYEGFQSNHSQPDDPCAGP